MVVDPDTGVETTGVCGTPSAASVSIPPGWGIRVRQPNVAGAKTKIFISGAHDPTVHISVPKKRSSGTYPGYWYSLPYNSAAQTYEDLCIEIGGGLGPVTVERGYAYAGAIINNRSDAPHRKRNNSNPGGAVELVYRQLMRN